MKYFFWSIWQSDPMIIYLISSLGFSREHLTTSISICSDCHRFSELSAWDSELAFWRLACLQAFHVPNLDSELLI